MNRFCVLAVFFLLALAGCGEHHETRQARLYGPEGARDTAAWSNAPFNGDQRAWEREIDARAETQNEYQRMR
jgi:hypothetical protein